MRRTVTIITLCVDCLMAVNAQTFTQKLQKSKAGEGTVTVTHSPTIDSLVNGVIAAKTEQKSPTVNRHSTTFTGLRDTTVYDQNGADSGKKVMKGYKVWGYRIQVFAGGNQRKDRQKAERIGGELKTLFPGQPVYVHFYSPRWICRVGNYRTYEEAVQMLSSIKKVGYNAATIIKEKITVSHYQ